MPSDTRLTLGTVGLIAALAGATGFALGRFTGDGGTSQVQTAQPEPTRDTVPLGAPQPAAPAPQADQMPPGHPPVDPNTAPPPMPPRDENAPRSLAWTKPASWSDAPNASAMRIATFKAPVAAGDKVAPEMTVMQAGGSLDANIDRWAGQFGDEGKASLKRESRTLAGYEAVVVSARGPYGGMSGEVKAGETYALLAAIVMTPDMPYFFKMTGPVKSVEAARKDFEALLTSFKKP